MSKELHYEIGIEKHSLEERRLRKWLEAGFDERAIAAYGTSKEGLRRILKGRKLTPTRPTYQEFLHYQKRLMQGGNYLQYAIPIPHRIRPINPGLAHFMESQPPGSEELEIQRARRLAMMYVRQNAVYDRFSALSGGNFQQFINAQHIVGVFEVFEGLDAEVSRLIGNDYSLFIIRELRKKGLSDQQIKATAKKSSQEYGIILYFGKEFLRHRVVNGPESPHDIIAISPDPISDYVISGVEIVDPAGRPFPEVPTLRLIN